MRGKGGDGVSASSSSRHDQYDGLLKQYAEEYGLEWRLLKRQMLAESGQPKSSISPGSQGAYAVHARGVAGVGAR